MDTQNMLIAVAGLIVLYVVVKLLKRNQSSDATTEGTEASGAQTEAPATVESANAATVAAVPNTSNEEERMTPNAANAKVPEEVIAVIAAAVAAMGYSSQQIASIRPAKLRNWTLEARLSGRRQG